MRVIQERETDRRPMLQFAHLHQTSMYSWMNIIFAENFKEYKKLVSAMSLLFGFFRCYKCQRYIEKLKCVCEKYQFKHKHRLNYKYKQNTLTTI